MWFLGPPKKRTLGDPKIKHPFVGTADDMKIINMRINYFFPASVRSHLIMLVLKERKIFCFDLQKDPITQNINPLQSFLSCVVLETGRHD